MTLAPATVGWPTFTLPPSETSSTRSKVTCPLPSRPAQVDLNLLAFLDFVLPSVGGNDGVHR